MGQAKQRTRQIELYLRSVEGVSCPECRAGGMDVVDLFTAVPLLHEPDMPAGPRYVCAACHREYG